MKKLNLFLIFISFISLSGFSQINVTSNVTWTGISVYDDIIVHPGATLTIIGGLQMPVDSYIQVKDGGALHGFNCTISTGGLGRWYGIYLDQTPQATPTIDYGLYLDNCRIEEALVAISSGYGVNVNGIVSPFGGGYVGAPDYQNRKIRANSTTLVNNNAHVMIYNDATYVVETLEHSTILFTNCNFGETAGGVSWPMHLISCKNVSFLYNDIEINHPSVSMLLHFRQMYDTRVIGNYLYSDYCKYYNAYHGLNRNIEIRDNDFDLTNGPTFAVKNGIETGDFVASVLDNFLVKDNHFHAGAKLRSATGIIADYFGFYPQKKLVNITGNTFTNLNRGIYSGNYDVEDVISDNTFSNCIDGITLIEQSDDLKILCNTFESCDNDIIIADGATIPDHNFGYDPGNTFSSPVPGYNILNNGPNVFAYHYATYMPVIPSVQPNIVLVQVNDVNDCSEGNGGQQEKSAHSSITDRNKSIAIKQHPNPAENYFEFSIDGDDQIDQLKIESLDGKRTRELQIFDNHGVVDVSDFQNGLYVCHYKSNGKTIVVKKLVVAH